MIEPLSSGEFAVKRAEAKLLAYNRSVRNNFGIIMAAIFAVVISSDKLPTNGPLPTSTILMAYLAVGIFGLHLNETFKAHAEVFGLPAPQGRVVQFAFFAYTLAGLAIFVWVFDFM